MLSLPNIPCLITSEMLRCEPYRPISKNAFKFLLLKGALKTLRTTYVRLLQQSAEISSYLNEISSEDIIIMGFIYVQGSDYF